MRRPSLAPGRTRREVPNTVRVALSTRLKATSAVTSLLSSSNAVYHRAAPQASKPPLIVFDKRSGVPFYMMGGDTQPVLTETWVVRGVSYGRTADRAEEIAAAIEACLTDAPLTLTGKVLLAIFKDSDISYPEQVGKELFQHEGGVYRIVTQPS